GLSAEFRRGPGKHSHGVRLDLDAHVGRWRRLCCCHPGGTAHPPLHAGTRSQDDLAGRATHSISAPPAPAEATATLLLAAGREISAQRGWKAVVASGRMSADLLDGHCEPFPNVAILRASKVGATGGTLTLNYVGLIAPIIKAIEALITELTTLES